MKVNPLYLYIPTSLSLFDMLRYYSSVWREKKSLLYATRDCVLTEATSRADSQMHTLAT